MSDVDLEFLVDWVSGWVNKMHRDISDEERGRIADDMCCDWANAGIGASFRETIKAMRLGRELDPPEATEEQWKNSKTRRLTPEG